MKPTQCVIFKKCVKNCFPMAFFHLAFLSMPFLVIAFLPNSLFTKWPIYWKTSSHYGSPIEISEDFSCQLGILVRYTYQSYEIKLASQAFLDGRSSPWRKLRQVRCLDVAKFWLVTIDSWALIHSCLLFTNLNFATS